MIRTRFAPSPTGDLHLGGAWTALASWALARASGGKTVLRVEDLDPPRTVRGSCERIGDDLAWLGFEWDERSEPQSSRSAIYDDAIAELERVGLVYPCDCSRAEIARIASAPHAGEEVVYPGICREASPTREFKRAPALRLRVPLESVIAFDDLLQGRVEQRIDVSVGDFVLRRGDGVYAYQLAVAVDDALMEISHVVRGSDLLSSTPRQILLMKLLGLERAIPTYVHVPMVVVDGARVAKRDQAQPSLRDMTIRSLRARGVVAEEIVASLASGLGLARTSERMTLAEVAAALEPPSSWRKEPWPVPTFKDKGRT